MMMELGIYVAGPLFSSGDLVTNTRAAIDAAQTFEQLQIEGVVLRPFVPHICVQTWQLVYPRGHVLAQDWDDFWLRRCDAVFRLPGYSVGSDHEEALADALGIPVHRTFNQLERWARAYVISVGQSRENL